MLLSEPPALPRAWLVYMKIWQGSQKVLDLLPKRKPGTQRPEGTWRN